MTINRIVALLASTAFAAGFSTLAAAQTDTTLAGGTFQTKITITKACTMSGTNTDVNFGDVASNAAGDTASASNGGFSVICTSGTPYKIGLQSTAAESGTDGTGTMKAEGQTSTIGYQLYQAAGATPWGNNTAEGGNVKAGTGIGSAQAHTVYAATTSTLNVPAATYSDTVSISVYY